MQRVQSLPRIRNNRLSPERELKELLRSELHVGGVCVLSIDSPPVNALSHPVRDCLLKAIRSAEYDDSVRAIIFLCAGRTFFAGADISEFGKPLQFPLLPFLLNEVEGLTKTTIAAIHGAALGGGLETALACHYRIAVPSAIVGLPEVTLGILPGAGGTQRLPRLTGIEFALPFVVKGKSVGAPRAHQAGILDRLAPEGKLHEAAIEYARELLDSNAPLLRVRDRTDRIRRGDADAHVFLDYVTRNARDFHGYKAPALIIDALRAAVELPFDEGLEREWQLLERLMVTREAAAQQYAFFAERTTRKVPGMPADTPIPAISSVAIVGTELPAVDIARSILDAGIPVRLIDASAGALERGLSALRSHGADRLTDGTPSGNEARQRADLLSAGRSIADAAGADLIIVALGRDLETERDLWSKLETIAKPDALLACTTSSVSVEKLAISAGDRLVALRFVPPGRESRLLEIVRTQATSPPALASALSFAKKIGKVPVVCRGDAGSICDRAMSALRHQAEAMVAEGLSSADVDRVLQTYGFAPGLIAPSAPAAPVPADRSADAPAVGEQRMRERLLYPVINEGAKMLEDGTAIRASDIDVAMIVGFGWPAFTGGPMFWADTIGVPNVYGALIDLRQAHGDAFRPARLLEQLSRTNRGFQQSEPSSRTDRPIARD